jgi:glycosyltransferase involved in cell wall biosynthesis
MIVAASGSVGVVILTRNRAALLRSALERLERLPERFPVVVVDDASADATAQIATRCGCRVVRLREPGGPWSRNIGVTSLDTPLVAFCDDDSEWLPGSLARAVELFGAHPRLGLLAGG